jgi:GTP-binding protein
VSIPRVVEAQFIKSAQSIADSLPENMSEVVFLGRSNVGKSSTLNSLTQRKNLAKSSATPGKTQLINFFETC